MDGRDPFRDLVALQDRMKEIFDESLEGDRQERFPRSWSPRVDIFETPEHLQIWIELSGVEKEDIRIRADENVLTVEGERRLPENVTREEYRLVERPFGPFSRSFSLPAGVDAGQIRASYRKGLLRIQIGRKPTGAARQIEIEGD